MNDNQKKVMKQAQDNLVRESLPFNHVFSSPEGVKVLAKLKEEFDPVTICNTSPHETLIRAAQRDVIRYIETMVKLREVIENAT